MSRKTNLPAVLFRPNGNSLSMERALKQIKGLLENYCACDMLQSEADRIEASLDDVETMLAAIAPPYGPPFVSVSYLVAVGGSGSTRMWLSDLPEWLDAHPYHMVIRLEVV